MLWNIQNQGLLFIGGLVYILMRNMAFSKPIVRPNNTSTYLRVGIIYI